MMRMCSFTRCLISSQGNEYRTGSGAPGPKYWQNRADYKINVALEEEKGTVSGDVEITYKNNSPENWNLSGCNSIRMHLMTLERCTNDAGYRWPFRHTGFRSAVILLKPLLFSKAKTNL
jgi:hypothetical protein